MGYHFLEKYNNPLVRECKTFIDVIKNRVQATILTLLPGTSLFDRMLAEDKIIFNNFPEDWQHYHFAEVVWKHSLMKPKLMTNEIKKNWDKLYNEKTLRRKFIRTLKNTNNPVAGIWSYGSNLHYHNMVFEHDRPKQDLGDEFDLGDFDSNPFM